MDFHLNSLSWLVGLSLLISALTESQFATRNGSSKKSSSLPRPFKLIKIPPELRPTPVAPPKTELVTRPPTVYRGVAVKCHADSMEVVVRADLFNTGLFVEAQHLHVGSNDCTAFIPSAEAELAFQFNLMDCGTTLSFTEDSLIYSNLLIYSPEPSLHGLLRLEGVTIPVECHYNKRYSVDGSAVQPSCIPFGSAATAEDQMEFKLTLMTDDWQHERGSMKYFLGDPIHVEVSVIPSDHVPLRIYVERCVATATPDTDVTLRYDFIEHHGCLSEAYLTGSGSRYLPRVQEDKLRFKLDAFMFQQDLSNLIYITCQLKAVPATTAVSGENRACSFIQDRWQSVDGNNQACDSCDSDRPFLAPSAEQAPSPSLTSTMEPVIRAPAAPQSEQHHTNARQAPANYFRFNPPSHLPTSFPSMKRSNSELTKTMSSGPLVILPSIIPTNQAHSAASLRPITTP